MEKVLKFEVDEIKLIQEISDSQLAIAEVKVCHDGMNLHELPISLETLKKATPTLINKFLVAGWSGVDFKGHEGKAQMIIGFFPKENDFRYVEEDDKTYLVCNAIVSKVYSSWAFEIFKKDNFRECSMEITVLETEEKDDGYEWITSFVFNGVTVLGTNHHAACPGSNVEIIKFSTDTMISDCEKVYSEYLNFSTNQNTNSATDNVDGIVNINSIKKEDSEMIFSKDEFAKSFSMTANEVWELLRNTLYEVKYQDGEYSYCKYWMRDYDDTYIYAYDEENSKLSAIPYSMNGGKAVCDFENCKNARLTYVVSDDTEDLVEFAEKILKNKMSQFAQEKDELNTKFSTLETEFNCMKETMSTLENEKVEMSEKISAFENVKVEFENKINSLETENGDLKTFKSNIEEQAKKTEVDFAINSVSEDLTQEQIDEWRNKVSEFENIELFSNAIKAFAYSVSKGKKKDDGIVTASIPFENTNNNKNKGLWD